jgi:hypothetical protein
METVASAATTMASMAQRRRATAMCRALATAALCVVAGVGTASTPSQPKTNTADAPVHLSPRLLFKKKRKTRKSTHTHTKHKKKNKKHKHTHMQSTRKKHKAHEVGSSSSPSPIITVPLRIAPRAGLRPRRPNSHMKSPALWRWPTPAVMVLWTCLLLAVKSKNTP